MKNKDSGYESSSSVESDKSATAIIEQQRAFSQIQQRSSTFLDSDDEDTQKDQARETENLTSRLGKMTTNKRSSESLAASNQTESTKSTNGSDSVQKNEDERPLKRRKSSPLDLEIKNAMDDGNYAKAESLMVQQATLDSFFTKFTHEKTQEAEKLLEGVKIDPKDELKTMDSDSEKSFLNRLGRSSSEPDFRTRYEQGQTNRERSFSS